MWSFIQEQILGMQWLNTLIGKGLRALGLDTASRWGGSILFFLYDVVKITRILPRTELKRIKPEMIAKYMDGQDAAKAE